MFKKEIEDIAKYQDGFYPDGDGIQGFNFSCRVVIKQKAIKENRKKYKKKVFEWYPGNFITKIQFNK